jgi:hypothetical protein
MDEEVYNEEDNQIEEVIPIGQGLKNKKYYLKVSSIITR